jgi:hypothetical protein
MVNPQTFKDDIEYRTYYRPSLHINEDSFFPHQGMVPHYKYIDHRLVDILGDVPDPRNQSFDFREMESYRYIENQDDLLYLQTLLLIPAFMLGGILLLKFFLLL